MARILIADCTDPEFTAALAKVLALKGFGTVATSSADVEGLWQRIVTEPPDLLLIDGKNAAEILDKIRNTTRAKGVRVLVVDSAHHADQSLPGADGYIRSPAPPQAYIQAVRDILTV